MRMLIVFAIPGIVLTSLSHAGVEPEPERPLVLSLSSEERARIVAALPDPAPRPTAERRLHSR